MSLGDVIVVGIIIAVVGIAITVIIKNKRKGKCCGCSACSCQGCAGRKAK